MQPEPKSGIGDTTVVMSSGEGAPEDHFRRQMGRVSSQSAIVFGGTVFYTVSNYLFKIYLARRLGPSPLGVYALGMTVVGVLSILGVAGLPQAAARFVAAYVGTRQYGALRGFLWRSLVVIAVMLAVCSAAMMLARRWVAQGLYDAPTLAGFMAFFAAIMVTGALVTWLGQVLAGFQDAAKRTFVTQIVANPIMILLAAAMIEMGWGLGGYLWAQIIGNAVALVLLSVFVWRLLPGEVRRQTGPAPPLGPGVVKFCRAVFAITVLEFILSQADKVILGSFLEPRAIGIYALAATMVAFVPVPLQSVNQIFAPMIADLHARGEQALLGRIYQTVTKWVIGFTFPFSLVLLLYAVPLLGIFGSAFVVGSGVLMIGTLGQLVNVAAGSVGSLLTMSGHQKRILQIEGIVAVLTVSMNLLLVPRLGMMGAAIAWATAAALMNLMMLYSVWRWLKLWPYNRDYLRLLPTLLASGATIWGLRTPLAALPGWVGIGIALAAGYAVFLAGALLLGLDDDDRIVADAVTRKLRGALPAWTK